MTFVRWLGVAAAAVLMTSSTTHAQLTPFTGLALPVLFGQEAQEADDTPQAQKKPAAPAPRDARPLGAFRAGSQPAAAPSGPVHYQFSCPMTWWSAPDVLTTPVQVRGFTDCEGCAYGPCQESCMAEALTAMYLRIWHTMWQQGDLQQAECLAEAAAQLAPANLTARHALTLTRLMNTLSERGAPFCCPFGDGCVDDFQVSQVKGCDLGCGAAAPSVKNIAVICAVAPECPCHKTSACACAATKACACVPASACPCAAKASAACCCAENNACACATAKACACAAAKMCPCTSAKACACTSAKVCACAASACACSSAKACPCTASACACATAKSCPCVAPVAACPCVKSCPCVAAKPAPKNPKKACACGKECTCCACATPPRTVHMPAPVMLQAPHVLQVPQMLPHPMHQVGGHHAIVLPGHGVLPPSFPMHGPMPQPLTRPIIVQEMPLPPGAFMPPDNPYVLPPPPPPQVATPDLVQKWMATFNSCPQQQCEQGEAVNVSAQVIRAARATSAMTTAAAPGATPVQITQVRGRIHLQTGKFEAQCQRLSCPADQDRLVLEGDVQITGQRNGQPVRIQAQRVLINLRDGAFVVEGGGDIR